MDSADWAKLAALIKGARKWGGEIDGDKLIAEIEKEAAAQAQREREAEETEEAAYNDAMESMKP